MRIKFWNYYCTINRYISNLGENQQSYLPLMLYWDVLQRNGMCSPELSCEGTRNSGIHWIQLLAVPRDGFWSTGSAIRTQSPGGIETQACPFKRCITNICHLKSKCCGVAFGWDTRQWKEINVSLPKLSSGGISF